MHMANMRNFRERASGAHHAREQTAVFGTSGHSLRRSFGLKMKHSSLNDGELSSSTMLAKWLQNESQNDPSHPICRAALASSSSDAKAAGHRVFLAVQAPDSTELRLLAENETTFLPLEEVLGGGGRARRQHGAVAEVSGAWIRF